MWWRRIRAPIGCAWSSGYNTGVARFRRESRASVLRGDHLGPEGEEVGAACSSAATVALNCGGKRHTTLYICLDKSLVRTIALADGGPEQFGELFRMDGSTEQVALRFVTQLTL